MITSPPPPPPRRGGIWTFGVVFLTALIAGAAGGVAGYEAASRNVNIHAGPIVVNEKAGKQLTPPGSVTAIVEKVRPSVVGVYTESVTTNLFLQPVPTEGAGTGIIYSADGHILTNSHVVHGAQKIEVVLSDGHDTKLQAKLVGEDIATDLAVIKIEAAKLTPAALGDSDQLRVGDRVIAVGNALALPGGPTVTDGIVSALDRSIQEPNGANLENLIQTDAAINPGNSGGALLNSNGNVVGINAAIAGNAQNIGFAIAITPARSIVDQLIKTGTVQRAFLGVIMETVTPEVAAQQNLKVSSGALVLRVVLNSPADKAGLQPGDVIVEIAGTAIKDSKQAQSAVASHKPGDVIEIVIAHGDQKEKLKVTLTQRP
jgi:S1-C subfamily serine protease